MISIGSINSQLLAACSVCIAHHGAPASRLRCCVEAGAVNEGVSLDDCSSSSSSVQIDVGILAAWHLEDAMQACSSSGTNKEVAARKSSAQHGRPSQTQQPNVSPGGCYQQRAQLIKCIALSATHLCCLQSPPCPNLQCLASRSPHSSQSCSPGRAGTTQTWASSAPARRCMTG